MPPGSPGPPRGLPALPKGGAGRGHGGPAAAAVREAGTGREHGGPAAAAVREGGAG
jgi:hypothetical protein